MFADDTKKIREIKTLGDASSLFRKTLGSLQLGLNHPVSFITRLSVRHSTLQRKQGRSYPLTNSTTPHLNSMLQKKMWAFGLVKISHGKKK